MEGSLNGGFRRKKFRIKSTAEEEIHDEPYSGENICFGKSTRFINNLSFDKTLCFGKSLRFTKPKF